MKFRSIALLMIAEVAALSMWFVSAAVLPEMLRDGEQVGVYVAHTGLEVHHPGRFRAQVEANGAEPPGM